MKSLGAGLGDGLKQLWSCLIMFDPCSSISPHCLYFTPCSYIFLIFPPFHAMLLQFVACCFVFVHFYWILLTISEFLVIQWFMFCFLDTFSVECFHKSIFEYMFAFFSRKINSAWKWRGRKATASDRFESWTRILGYLFLFIPHLPVAMFLTKKQGVREMPVKEPVCILPLLCWKIVRRPEPSSSKRTNTQANEKIEIWIQDLVNAGWRSDEGKTKFGHAGWEWGRREEKRTLHWSNGWWPVYRRRLRSFLQKKSNYVEKPRPWTYGGYLTFGYPQIIHFGGIFHYKPSILGIPPWWKPIWEHLVKIASVARKPNNFFSHCSGAGRKSCFLLCRELTRTARKPCKLSIFYRLNLTFLPTLEPRHTACLWRGYLLYI